MPRIKISSLAVYRVRINPPNWFFDLLCNFLWYIIYICNLQLSKAFLNLKKNLFFTKYNRKHKTRVMSNKIRKCRRQRAHYWVPVNERASRTVCCSDGGDASALVPRSKKHLSEKGKFTCWTSQRYLGGLIFWNLRQQWARAPGPKARSQAQRNAIFFKYKTVVNNFGFQITKLLNNQIKMLLLKHDSTSIKS